MQSKICVLQVIPNLDVSGASQGCVDVANYLTEKNYNSYIATNSGQNIKKVNEHETKVIKVPVHSKNPLIIILNIFRLARIIKLFGINILHVRSRAPAWSSYFACLITHTKYVSTFHGTYNFNNVLKKYYNSIMLMTDGTIAISKFIYDEIKTKYQKMPKVIKIIPRGIDLEFFNVASINQQIKNDILTEFKINKDAIKIMLPGRMTEWKGHLLLLKAFKQVSQQTDKKLELLLVGPENNTSLKID
jgi:Glycosyltransferase